MVAYRFRARFAGLILSGAKCQTIRGEDHIDRERDDRPGHVLPGQTMELFSIDTTAGAGRRLIGRASCERVCPVTLYLAGTGEGYACAWSESNPDPRLATYSVHKQECNAFAERDGFASWRELVASWHEAHPGLERFDGLLISWKPLDGWTP